MRGGFVACVGGEPRVLERVVERLRWHRGKPLRDHRDGLEIAALVDPVEGPTVEARPGGARLVHGASPAPLAALQRTPARFAALEWDGRVLRASRDPMGLVPLFYRVWQGGVWLATEVEPLVALDRPAADLEALDAQAAFTPLDERTGWGGIYRVLPGSTLEVEPGRPVTSSLYWTPEARFGRYRGSRGEAVAELRERFRVAVARCWHPGGGILLSGGLDSAAVAAAAAAAGGSPPHLVHVHFPSLPVTHEERYARTVAQAVGAPLHVVPGDVSPWDVEAELEAWGLPYSWLPYGMQEPALAHLASRGVTVALDGHDGDGALGPAGGEWGDLILKGRVTRMARVVGRHGVRRVLIGAGVDLLPPYAWLRRLAGRPPKVTHLQAVARYFRAPARRRIHDADIDRWRWPPQRWRIRQLQPLRPRAAIAFEQKEREAARHDIDMRHPFADRELLEFLISLPVAIKSEPGRPKALLLDALGDWIPEALRARRKSDYQAVVRRRADVGACLERIRASGVRLPEVDYERLFLDARTDPGRVPFFLAVNLVRVHAFAERVQLAREA